MRCPLHRTRCLLNPPQASGEGVGQLDAEEAARMFEDRLKARAGGGGGGCACLATAQGRVCGCVWERDAHA